MFLSLTVADVRLIAQRHIANIRIKPMLYRVAVPVGFIGAHRVFIPLAGEHALAANRLKAMADAANSGEQIDITAS